MRSAHLRQTSLAYKKEIRNPSLNTNLRMLKNSNLSQWSRLRDYDWNLVHVMGSSSLANLQENLVILSLHVSEEAEALAKEPKIVKTVTVELTRNELDKLISSLEHCQQKLIKTN